MGFFDKLSAEYNIANTVKVICNNCNISLQENDTLTQDELTALANHIAFSNYSAINIPKNLKLALLEVIDMCSEALDRELSVTINAKNIAVETIHTTKASSGLSPDIEKEMKILKEVFGY